MIVVAAAFILGFLLTELWTIVRQHGSDGGARVKPGVVGQVGRREVTVNEYREALQFMGQKYLRDSMLRELSAEDEARVNQLAWEYLLNEISWNKVMNDTRLRLTEGELEWLVMNFPPQSLRERPELMTDGKFDTLKYHQLLQNPENQGFFSQYARDLYEQLRQQKLQLYVAAAYRPTTAETAEVSRGANSVWKTTSLFFGPEIAQAAGDTATPSDAEALAYYRKHIEEFRRPKETRELVYVTFPLPLNFDDIQAARQRIEAAYARIRAAADTASRRDSIEAAMFADGDFEPDTASLRFAKSELDSATAAVAAQLRPGQFSAPHPVASGFQITILDSVRRDTFWLRRVRTRPRVDNAREIAVIERVRTFLDSAAKVGFDTAAQQLGLVLSPAPAVMTGGELSRLPVQLYAVGQLVEWARNAREGAVTEFPLRGPGGLYIFKLRRVLPAEPIPFENVKQAVRWRVRQEKQKRTWIAAAEKAAQAIRGGMTLEAYAAAHPEVRLDTLTVNSVNDMTARGARGPQFIGALLGLETGQTTGPIVSEWGAYIIRCDERKDFPMGNVQDYVQGRQRNITEALWQQIWKQHEIRDFRQPQGF